VKIDRFILPTSSFISPPLCRTLCSGKGTAFLIREKGVDGYGVRERLLTIHLMEALRKNREYETKLGLKASIKSKEALQKERSAGAPIAAEREFT